MEKVMSVEDKIRRAEEIYNRRNSISGKTFYSNEKNMAREHSLKYRMIKQLIVCLMIYGIFYAVNNREYLLSYDFQEKVRIIASRNEMLNNTYSFVYSYIDKYLRKNEINDENIKNENTLEVPAQESGQLINNNENIGGSDEVKIVEEKNQEQKDIEDIKKTIRFILPIEGSISSTFGWRTPTTATVPKYHTGLDIAAPIGTVIKSATEGTVILSSNQGDYGKHYQIQVGDVILVYAHCSKLYLKEGDRVYQGQEIAEVGSTGNSTGPHLHFEIRKEDRLVDPQLILDI